MAFWILDLRLGIEASVARRGGQPGIRNQKSKLEMERGLQPAALARWH
jgi:hypothetical protein